MMAIRTDDHHQQIRIAGDINAAIAPAYMQQIPVGNVQQIAANVRRLQGSPMALLDDKNVEILQNIQHGQIQ
jgi:hypothetical protein